LHFQILLWDSLTKANAKKLFPPVGSCRNGIARLLDLVDLDDRLPVQQIEGALEDADGQLWRPRDHGLPSLEIQGDLELDDRGKRNHQGIAASRGTGQHFGIAVAVEIADGGDLFSQIVSALWLEHFGEERSVTAGLKLKLKLESSLGFSPRIAKPARETERRFELKLELLSNRSSLIGKFAFAAGVARHMSPTFGF